jgi:putative ABC transport system permease protein
MARLGERHRIFIHTNASIRAEVLRIFDSTFAITYALEAIAVFVGILGVSGTLLTLILERRRELTTLRLVGADRRQVRKMVVIEAGLIGVVSQVLGTVAGLGLALILIYVINVQSFGWTIQFDVPGVFLLQSSLALFVATALAGLYPARLAAAVQAVEHNEE